MSASREATVAHDAEGAASPEDAVLGEAADRLLAARADLWERLPNDRRVGPHFDTLRSDPSTRIESFPRLWDRDGSAPWSPSFGSDPLD